MFLGLKPTIKMCYSHTPFKTIHRTAHDRSHQNANDRMEKLKWPWERIINRSIEDEADPDEQHFSNKEMYRKFKSVH